MHLRRKLVAGNWKMNGSLAALAELAPVADAARAAGGVDVAVCPPFTLIAPAVTRAGGAVFRDKFHGSFATATLEGVAFGCSSRSRS